MAYDIYEENGNTYRLSVRGKFDDGCWFDVDDVLRIFLPSEAEYDGEENIWTIPEGSFNKMVYDFMYFENKSLEAGVYYELKGFEIVKSKSGKWMNFNRIMELMDKGLRKRVYRYNAKTGQEFFEIYARMHKEKFGKDFVPYVDGEW